MIDILFCSVPWIASATPTLAPAVLKACAQNAGYTAKTMHLDIDVYKLIQTYTNKDAIINFFQTQELDSLADKDIADIIETCAQRIVDADPKIVGLSLLSQDSQFFTWWLCYHLRYIAPSLKIIIGGSGIKSFIAQSTLSFAQEIKRAGLIDDFITGDGEIAVVEYLKNNLSYPGINSDQWQQLTDLDSTPYPDFSDYDFGKYAVRGIPICDSRGCVRTCEFCDIIEHWKKYQYRTADNVFQEMLHQIELYNIRHFYFYNSLTNGNMKEFTKLLDLICDYNTNNKHQISWDGYFIVRNQQQHPEEIWPKLRLSNANLQLGIESVVEHVRKSLGKNFSNADIDYHLTMAKKYKVPLMLLLIVGYPTETIEDYEFTRGWFRQRKEYARMPIKSVVCTLSAILPGTKLERNQEKYNIVKGNLPTIWINQHTNIDEADRVQHLNQLLSVLSEIGIAGGSDVLTKRLSEA
jgi:radical SAM superfamily enzyme YgiQ (UPF0313 family)